MTKPPLLSVSVSGGLFTVDSIEEFTGIRDFGQYQALTLEIDMFFLNEDRHTNNIALIYHPGMKKYRICPQFDNGLALLADTSTDFQLDKPLSECIGQIQAKPFSTSFDDQADEAVNLYGRQVSFEFRLEDVAQELEVFRGVYDDRILERVQEILRSQIRKYQYLFR